MQRSLIVKVRVVGPVRERHRLVGLLPGAVLVLWMLGFSAPVNAANIPANSDAQFHAALRAAKPSDHIVLGSARSRAVSTSVGLAGAKGKPIRISGSSPRILRSLPPRRAGFFNSYRHRISKWKTFTSSEPRAMLWPSTTAASSTSPATTSPFATSASRMSAPRARPTGSSWQAFRISRSPIASFQKWGEGGGCAIDGVGCKDGTVDRCVFLPGRGSVAIQFKGGSSRSPSARAYSMTRPRGDQCRRQHRHAVLPPQAPGFEARKITIEGKSSSAAMRRSPSPTPTALRCGSTRSTCRRSGPSASFRKPIARISRPRGAAGSRTTSSSSSPASGSRAASTSAPAPRQNVFLLGQRLVLHG